MTDYLKATGTHGQMLIRDDGTYIEMWVTANNDTTYQPKMPWAFVVNGNASIWLYYNYRAGSGWERLLREKVTTTQTVTFRLGDTDTKGLGGPTTFSVYIIRPKVPDAPIYVPPLNDITSSSFRVKFKDGDDNFAPIDARQIGYGTNESTPQKTVSVSGPATGWETTITGLEPGKRHYFWGRTHNSKGWGPWSSRWAFTTLSVVRINVGGVWKTAVPYVNVGGVWKMANPWSKSSGVWKEAK